MIDTSLHRSSLGQFTYRGFFFLGLLMWSGCSESGPARYAITGEVTLDGIPVEDASIVLTPARGGISSMAKISEGKFSIPLEFGPTQGEFNVRINPAEAELDEFSTSPQVHKRTNVKRPIPKAYQVNGSLTAVVSGHEDQVLKFALSSRDH